VTLGRHRRSSGTSTRHFCDEKEIILRAIPLALAAAVLLTTSVHAVAAKPVTVFLLEAKEPIQGYLTVKQDGIWRRLLVNTR
jgi:hypothetical protein